LLIETAMALGMMPAPETVRSCVPGRIDAWSEAQLGPDALSRTGLPDGTLR
jgi:hypothetical protein